MNKKFKIFLTTTLTILIIGVVCFVIIKQKQEKEAGRQVFNLETFISLEIKDEKTLNKSKKELTDIDLPPTEYRTFIDEQQVITFQIPYNPNWGGNKYYMEPFEKKGETISFGPAHLLFAEMTPAFLRSFWYTKAEKDKYEEIKNAPASDCPKSEEVKIGENIFLKEYDCGMLGGINYWLSDFGVTYLFVYEDMLGDEQMFLSVLKSIKHTDGTPFRVAFLTNLDTSGATTTFAYENKDVKLSFSYPKRWGQPDFNYNTSTIDYSDPMMGWPEGLEKQKKHIIETGQISAGFFNSYNEPKICPNAFDCGIWLSIIPYDEQKNIVMDCYESSCSLGESLLSTKTKLSAKSNYKVDDYPAFMEDLLNFMGTQNRKISFFTPKYYVTLSVNFSDDDIRLVDLDGVDLTKQIELTKTLERSRNATELKSVLQEFMNLVDSFKIE